MLQSSKMLWLGLSENFSFALYPLNDNASFSAWSYTCSKKKVPSKEAPPTTVERREMRNSVSRKSKFGTFPKLPHLLLELKFWESP